MHFLSQNNAELNCTSQLFVYFEIHLALNKKMKFVHFEIQLAFNKRTTFEKIQTLLIIEICILMDQCTKKFLWSLFHKKFKSMQHIKIELNY